MYRWLKYDANKLNLYFAMILLYHILLDAHGHIPFGWSIYLKLKQCCFIACRILKSVSIEYIYINIIFEDCENDQIQLKNIAIYNYC